MNRTLVFKDQNKLKKQSVIELLGHVVAHPKVLTGGGDNLNAGYCLGLLAGFEVHYCMLLAMAASGAYVQNGESPDMSAIIEFIDKWVLAQDNVAKLCKKLHETI